MKIKWTREMAMQCLIENKLSSELINKPENVKDKVMALVNNMRKR